MVSSPLPAVMDRREQSHRERAGNKSDIITKRIEKSQRVQQSKRKATLIRSGRKVSL
jgi:hypothetical protein